MSNSYLVFSEMIYDLNSDEVKWLEKELQVFDAEEAGSKIDTDDLPETFARMILNNDYVRTCIWPGFDCEFKYREEDGRSITDLWVYSEEHGDPEILANIVQGFIAKFRPHETWVLTWIAYKSKPMVGSINGGYVVVSAERQIWADLHELAHQENELAHQEMNS